jgi:hypothetical protein
MSKINFIHLRKNISMIFAATYVALSFSIAQAASSQNSSSSYHLDLKSTIAQSQCSLWNVGRRFTAVQSNTSQPLRFNLGTGVNKELNYMYLVGNVKYGNVFGEVINDPNAANGNYFVGDEFSFIVRWNNGSTGRYNARIDSNGYLSGDITDVDNPSSKANWFVRKPFQCLRQK